MEQFSFFLSFFFFFFLSCGKNIFLFSYVFTLFGLTWLKSGHESVVAKNYGGKKDEYMKHKGFLRQ